MKEAALGTGASGALLLDEMLGDMSMATDERFAKVMWPVDFMRVCD